jgi:hypothetical protein
MKLLLNMRKGTGMRASIYEEYKKHWGNITLFLP